MNIQAALTRTIQHTGVTLDEMRSDGRMMPVVRARMLFVLLARDHCGEVPYIDAKAQTTIMRPRYSFPNIAEVLKPGRSHTTALCRYQAAKKDEGLVQQARVIAGGG